MRKEAWFGFSIMAIVVILVFWILPAPSQMTNGHLGLLMLAMIVMAIMLGFPTAFTLMGMGTMFAFFSYYSENPSTALTHTLDLMVLRAYAVMNNDVLISVPLFVFMGYLVERSNLIAMLFKSLHLATSRIPGSLAVATIVTCAIFATASGIIGAVVTLMGLLAFPSMLKAGYSIRLSAGVCDCRRHPRHLDPALGSAHPLRRHRRRVGGPALRRRFLPRHYAGRALRRLRHHLRENQSQLAPPLSEEDAVRRSAQIRGSDL